MKRFDMHIHSYNTPLNTQALLCDMEKAGIYGGCVFSNRPKEDHKELGSTFEERLNEVLSITKGFENRLFPVLWIHPFEENIFEKIKIAVDSGIVAFKMICCNYYVYDEKCIAVLKEIARLNKPVIFHTGILWDGRVTSEYNRPLNFESLISIKGLKFSMGHCSWPWIDECIALYGKFLNTLNTQSDIAEMFFDITPGTPEIYRKELLTKLYTIGYDVGDNVMFGTDSKATDYRPEWTKKWLELDGKILNELGVSEENLNKLYYKNLLRFLGKEERTTVKIAPDINDSKPWSPVEPRVAQTIEKWYKKLEFSCVYDNEFYSALNSIPVSDYTDINSYDLSCENGKRNFLSFLYMCEKLSLFYKEKGIPEQILSDTLTDLKIWTRTWSNLKKELYLGEISWLSNHFKGKLFKIGRLQFCMSEAPKDFPCKNIKKGDNVVEIHVPEGGKLTKEECEKSVSMAKEFFKTYFPEFSYEYFTCHSWLLDDVLKKYLPENSNILNFGNMFEKIESEIDNAVLRYVFNWNTNSENIVNEKCDSEFATKIKKAFLSKETFHSTLGVLKK